MNESEGLSEKLKDALKDGLLIAYRVKNHQLLYSIMNRPEPNLSGVDDHVLATAIVFAANKFKIVVDDKIAKPETIERVDGRSVTYDEFIDIDWDDCVIRSSRRSEMTITALKGVVYDLMSKAPAPSKLVKPPAAN